MDLKFCILILSYNHPELTARAVQSALDFSSNSDSIILVHNGSDLKHRDILTSRFHKVRHEILASNKGYSGGVNAGFRQALAMGFDWIFLLTNDCVLSQIHVPTNLEPGLIAPLIHRRKQGQIDSCGGIFQPARAHIFHARSAEEFMSCVKSGGTKNLPYIPGSAFWIHRSVIEHVGLMDESLGTYWEDVDYSARAHLAGIPLQFDSRTEVLHQVGKTNHKDPRYTTYFFQRNRRVVSKRYVTRDFFSNLRLQWILELSWLSLWLHFCRRGHWPRARLLWQARQDAQKMKSS